MTPTRIKYQQNNIYCGVRVSTSVSRCIEFLPYDQVVNTGFLLNDIGLSSASLIEQLISAVDFSERKKALENWLMTSGVLSNRETDIVDYCLEEIQCNYGAIRIIDLANNLGVSDRLLRKKFSQSIGMSPKQYSRIVKFQNLIYSLLYATPSETNNHSSMRCCYYDDSHLIRDFKHFTEMTPSCFLNSVLDLEIKRTNLTESSKFIFK
ncbi:AraC family transcriptional regulator [Marinomonas epiphytica]